VLNRGLRHEVGSGKEREGKGAGAHSRMSPRLVREVLPALSENDVHGRIDEFFLLALQAG